AYAKLIEQRPDSQRSQEEQPQLAGPVDGRRREALQGQVEERCLREGGRRADRSPPR
ncbi:hypothetical protein KI387_016166, partial [Taxus chinensis]